MGTYTTAGAPVNPTLIAGLSNPTGVAVSGSSLFVSNYGTGTVAEYTTSGTPVNPTMITGLSSPTGIAVVTPVPAAAAHFPPGLGFLAIAFRKPRMKGPTKCNQHWHRQGEGLS